MKSINPYYFLISFAIGMFFVYISTPPPDVIIQYPTPENAGKIIYKDNGNNNDDCYVYDAKKVSCPIDESKIEKIPFQSAKNGDKNNRNPFENIYSYIKNGGD